MLKIDLKPGESVRIGPYAVVTLESKAGKAARLSFQADTDVKFSRVPAPSAAPKAQANPLHGIMNVPAAA